MKKFLCILLLCMLFLPAMAESDPADVCVSYYEALKNGDIAGASALCTGESVPSDWDIPALTRELIWPSISGIEIESTAVTGDTAAVTLRITALDLTDVAVIEYQSTLQYEEGEDEKSDPAANDWWSLTGTEAGGSLWEEIDIATENWWTELYNRTPVNEFEGYAWNGISNDERSKPVADEARKNRCEVTSRITLTLTRMDGEWKIDIAESGEKMRAARGVADAPDIWLDTYEAQGADYATELFHEKDLWLRLRTDAKDSERLDLFRKFTFSDTTLVCDNSTRTFTWSTGYSEYIARSWETQNGVTQAILSATLENGAEAQTLLQAGTLTCAYPYEPENIYYYEKKITVPTSAAKESTHFMTSAVGAKMTGAKQVEITDTFTKDEYNLTFTHSVNPDWDCHVWHLPQDFDPQTVSEKYNMYCLTGEIENRSMYPLMYLTFSADLPDGYYMMIADECSMCDSIDANDVGSLHGRRIRVYVLVDKTAASAEDALALLSNTSVTIHCSTENLTWRAEGHTYDSAAGPRHTVVAAGQSK